MKNKKAKCKNDKMNELKNIDVHLISLVDKGANKRKVICKSEGAAEDDKYTLRKNDVRIAKVDDEKHLVYGVVYAPDDADAHDDFATAEEIEKAAHNFLAKSNTQKAVDTQHNLVPEDGVTIVESAIIKGKHSILTGEPDGTWFIVTKIDNEEIWKSVKDGTYTGYSLYGFAERIEKEKSEKAKGKKFESLMKRIEKWFDEDELQAESNEVVKSFDDIYRRMQLRTMADALCSAVWDVLYNDLLSMEQKIEGVGQVMDDAWAKMSTIDLAKSEIVAKAGKVISDQNKKKLESAKTTIEEILALAGGAEEKKSIQKSKIKNNMEDTVKKADHDKAIEDLKKEHEEALKKVQDELEAKKAELEKASPGSKQAESTETKKEEVKKIFPWV